VHPFGKTYGLREWYEGEHLHYNEAFPNFKSTNLLSLGEGDTLASLQSYHTVIWNGSFAGVPAPHHKPLIKIKDLDFYILKNGKIHYNWCMVDVVSILQQGGYNILPLAPLPDGLSYLPPRSMDGIPSPDSDFVRPQDAKIARQTFADMLDLDFVQQSTAAASWTDDMMWLGPAGIGDAWNSRDYVEHFLIPLHTAFPQQSLEIGSSDCEGNYCGALFYLTGRHSGAWLGEAPTHRNITMKFGMHARINIEKRQIVDAWVQLDVVDVFAQMGIDLLNRARERSRWHNKRPMANLTAAPEAASVGQSAQEHTHIAVICFVSLGSAVALVAMRKHGYRRVGVQQASLLA